MTKIIAENSSLLLKKLKQTSETAKKLYDEILRKDINRHSPVDAGGANDYATISLNSKHAACIEI